MRIALIVLAVALLAGCSKKVQHIDPPRDVFANSVYAQTAALNRAVGALGQHVAGPIHGTSMEPLIGAGDWVILQERSFLEVRLGRIYGYLPKPGADFPRLDADYNALPIHRAVLQDSGGFLLSGDNAPVSDSSVRMTEKNLVGECIYIAHVAP